MLVLGRREGDKVLIQSPTGETVIVTVCRRRHGHLRLGFEAPEDHKIIRAETVGRVDKKQPVEASKT